MTLPTANAVPSSAPQDLLFNAEKIDEAVNSAAHQYTDRKGIPRLTLEGAMSRISAVNPRGNWATATAYSVRDLVLSSGTWYIAVDSHVSGATFAGDQAAHWRVFQGITQNQLNDTSSFDLGSGMVGDGGPTLNYVAGTIGYTVNQEIRVTSFVIADAHVDKTGTANAAPFFQAAIDFAELLITTNNAYNDLSVQIVVPGGKYNFLGDTVTWSNNGISVVGPQGRGATILGDGSVPLFAIGDPTNTFRTRKASLVNIQCVTLNVTNTASAVTLYRTATANILECTFVNWNVALDCTRTATTQIRGCWFDNPNRTTAALASIRSQGTDETAFTSPEPYTPGGGFHVVDCEFSGSSTTVHTAYAFMARSVDGLYMNNCHFVGYENTVGLVPEGTASCRVIIDVNIVNCYFDEPSKFSSAAHCILLAGTVKETIAANVGTYSSVFRGIRVSNCLLRGDYQASSCLQIAVTDGDSWWDNPNTALQDIIINGNTIRQSTQRGITVLGAASGSYVEPRNLVISNNVFDDNNSSGSTGSASDIAVQAENVTIVGNTFGPARASGADYSVVVLAYDGGATDTNNPGVVITGNNFSRVADTNPPLIQPLWVTKNTNTGNTLESDNLFPGTGKRINEVYKLRTTDGTPTDIWSYQVPQGTCGYVEVELNGSNLTGSKAVGYSWRVHFRNNAGVTSLSSGGSSFTSVTTWNPDTFPTPPTATLSGDLLHVQVAGPDGSTIMNWTACVKGVLAR